MPSRPSTKAKAAPAPANVVRRSPIKNRLIALLLTIIGVAIFAVGWKQQPNALSVPVVIGILLVVAGIVFRLKKSEVKFR
jgi:uncharacterized protein (TIGR04206 family)